MSTLIYIKFECVTQARHINPHINKDKDNTPLELSILFDIIKILINDEIMFPFKRLFFWACLLRLEGADLCPGFKTVQMMCLLPK